MIAPLCYSPFHPHEEKIGWVLKVLQQIFFFFFKLRKLKLRKLMSGCFKGKHDENF